MDWKVVIEQMRTEARSCRSLARMYRDDGAMHTANANYTTGCLLNSIADSLEAGLPKDATPRHTKGG